MTKRTKQTKVTIYRRHAGKCPLKAEPLNLGNCECPLWMHGKINGQFLRQSLDTRSLVAATMRVQAMIDGPPPNGGGIAIVAKSAPVEEMTLEQATADFLASKARKSTNTRSLYQRAVEHFGDFIRGSGVTLLRDINTAHVRAYFAEFDRNWARNSSQARLIQLRVFFNYCVEQRWLTHSPVKSRDLNYAKGAKTSQRVPFSPAEITRILAAVEAMPEDQRDRARALCTLLLYTGMRISDATFFERSCLTKRSTADYIVIKTRHRIALAPELQKPALDALAKLPPSRVYFFQPDAADDYRDARVALREGREFAAAMPDFLPRVAEATRIVRRVLALAGVEGACHRFRDTFAINLLVGGADIYTVSKMLGHSDVKITDAHYVKLVDGYQDKMSQSTRKLAYVFPQAV